MSSLCVAQKSLELRDEMRKMRIKWKGQTLVSNQYIVFAQVGLKVLLRLDSKNRYCSGPNLDLRSAQSLMIQIGSKSPSNPLS